MRKHSAFGAVERVQGNWGRTSGRALKNVTGLRNGAALTVNKLEM